MSVGKRLASSPASSSGPITNLTPKQLPPEHIFGSDTGRYSPYVSQEIKNLMEKLKTAGRYELLKKFLSPRELQVLELRIDREPALSYADVSKELGMFESNICAIQRKILKKMRIVLEADDSIFSKTTLKEVCRKSIVNLLQLVEVLLAQGKTIDEIVSVFNKTERRVFDTYVMAKPPVSAVYAAETLSLSRASITKAVANMIEVLSGKGRNNRYKEKYKLMSKKELASAVIALKCQDRSELHLRNYSLAFVANSRGILDGILPKQRGKTVKEIKEAYEELKKTNTPEQIISLLAPIEAKYLQEVILSPSPISDKIFIERHKSEMRHGLLYSKKNLLAKLKGEAVTGQENLVVFHQLKEVCSAIGTEELERLKPSMKQVEISILKNRILAEKPMTLRKLGDMFNVSREEIRQTEAELLETLLQIRFLPDHRPFPKKEHCGKLVREIRGMLLTLYKNGITTGQIFELLDTGQKQALEIYVLSSKSLDDASSEIGICSHAVYLRTLAIQMKLTSHIRNSGLFAEH